MHDVKRSFASNLGKVNLNQAENFLKTMKAKFFTETNILIFVSLFTFTALAQMNTDSSGYVTNANLLTPFTLTNSAGNVVIDAVLVKLMPNKFIYKTTNGDEGMLRLDSLSKDLQVKFGYNSTNALAADRAEKLQEQIWKQQKESAVQDAYWDVALKNSVAPFIHRKRVINGRMVNLSPLFLWWKSPPKIPSVRNTSIGQTNNDAATLRPLAAWVHITGAILGSEGNCWIVNAKIEDMPGRFTQAKITLQNPPADEQRQFASAGAELKKINDRIDFVATQIGYAFDDANSTAQSINTASALNPNSAGYWNLVHQKEQIENRKASLIQEEDNLKSRREEIWQFLRQFPSGNIYQLNIFAMNTGNVISGLPLYDLGVYYP